MRSLRPESLVSLLPFLPLLFGACESPGGGGGQVCTPGVNCGFPDATTAPDVTTTEDGTTTLDGTAASDGTSATETVDTGSPDTTHPVDIEEPTQGAPRILQLASNVQRITQYEQVVISAVVTDPDGIDDLIGGTLKDPVSGSTYGAFATSAAEGAYSLSLVWEQIDQTRSIDFQGSTARAFVAEFFDQAGNTTRGELSLTLHCGDGGAACSGQCEMVDCGGGCIDHPPTEERNCGACGRTCGNNEYCNRGDCVCDGDTVPCDGACIDVSADSANCGQCGFICAGGSSCLDSECVFCEPQCTGRECGPDGCGGSCGTCPSGSCSDGQCPGSPGGWTCDPSFKGGQDGCDCGCGQIDPDCEGPTVSSCDYCDGDGACSVTCSDIATDNNGICR